MVTETVTLTNIPFSVPQNKDSDTGLEQHVITKATFFVNHTFNSTATHLETCTWPAIAVKSVYSPLLTDQH